MEIEEKLDLILNEIKDHYSRHPIPENWSRICRLVTGGNGVNSGDSNYKDNPLLKGLISSLEEEGYIFRTINYPSAGRVTNFATIKGLTFEGFVNQKKRIENEKNELSTIKNEQRKQEIEQLELNKKIAQMNFIVVYLTFVLTFVGIVTAIHDIVETVMIFNK